MASGHSLTASTNWNEESKPQSSASTQDTMIWKDETRRYSSTARAWLRRTLSSTCFKFALAIQKSVSRSGYTTPTVNHTQVVCRQPAQDGQLHRAGDLTQPWGLITEKHEQLVRGLRYTIVVLLFLSLSVATTGKDQNFPSKKQIYPSHLPTQKHQTLDSEHGKKSITKRYFLSWNNVNLLQSAGISVEATSMQSVMVHRWTSWS